MTAKQIEQIVEEREFHIALLGTYRGPYSLGVIGPSTVLLSLPDTPDALRLSVSSVQYEGIEINVEIKRGWKPPQKLRVG